MKLTKKEQLQKEAIKISKCVLCKINKNGLSVPGEGNADAQVVFVGEAPGKQEAKTGLPFIGRAGKILRSLIKEVGLSDEGVYITSAVKYLPDYITPKLEDIEHGRGHLFKQLDIINPKIVVLLGSVAIFAVLNKKAVISKEHGSIVKKDGRCYFITFHPAAPLYAPRVKKLIGEDFSLLKSLLKRYK